MLFFYAVFTCSLMWALNNINILKAALQLFSFHLYFVCCDSMWHLRISVDLAIFPHSGYEKLWEKHDSFRMCFLCIGLSDSGSSFLHGQIWLKEILHTEHLCTALLEFLRSTQRGKHLILYEFNCGLDLLKTVFKECHIHLCPWRICFLWAIYKTLCISFSQTLYFTIACVSWRCHPS